MSPPEADVDEAARLTRLARRAGGEAEARAHRKRRDRLLARHGYRARVRVEGGPLGGAGPAGADTVAASGRDGAVEDRRETGNESAPGETGRRAVLVCYPAEWVVDGTVDPTRIEDTSRAVERQLTGPGEDREWAAVESHNRDVADRVADEHGAVHGANAHAFADFMGNHYARRVETATEAEVREFLEEYFPRNTWPSPDQRAVVEESVRLVREHGRS